MYTLKTYDNIGPVGIRLVGDYANPSLFDIYIQFTLVGGLMSFKSDSLELTTFSNVALTGDPTPLGDKPYLVV